MIIPINQKLQDARDEEGFTLIELMIVVVIIGILAAIAIPIFTAQQANAHKASVKSDVRNTVTNVATALAKNPTATGFVGYKVGDAVPTVAAGQVPVQLITTNNNTVAITGVAASGSAPDSGTGNGSWDSYEVIGKTPAVSGYCYFYISTTGKSTDSTNCSAADNTSTGSATSSPSASATATAAPEVLTSFANYTFESGVSGWTNIYTGTNVNTSNSQKNSGSYSMYYYSGNTSAGAHVYNTFTAGQKYRFTAYVYQESSSYTTTMNIASTPAASASTSAYKSWTPITFDWTPKTSGNVGLEIYTSGNNAAAFVDDVTIQKVN